MITDSHVTQIYKMPTESFNRLDALMQQVEQVFESDGWSIVKFDVRVHALYTTMNSYPVIGRYNPFLSSNVLHLIELRAANKVSVRMPYIMVRYWQDEQRLAVSDEPFNRLELLVFSDSVTAPTLKTILDPIMLGQQ